MLPNKPTTTPLPLTAETIETWALEHKAEAKVLGMYIVGNTNTTKEQLAKLPSRGEFEDRAILWAVDHPAEARALVMRLLPRFM